jgi:hypothetical protein
MNPQGVILFHTTSSAMRTEKVLKKAALTIKLIPTPREFSSDCGIALRFEWNQLEVVRALIEEARVEIAGMHCLSPSLL